MNLKSVTLLAAIAQLLALMGNVFNFVGVLGRVSGAQGQVTIISTYSLSILAQAMLVWFLFYLFTRQKSE